MEAPTIIYYPAPERGALTPQELALTLGTALDGNPKLEQAVRQVLAQRLAFATAECADPKLDERSAGHAGGRAAEILSLQHELANYTRQARELRARETGTTRPPRARGTVAK